VLFASAMVVLLNNKRNMDDELVHEARRCWSFRYSEGYVLCRAYARLRRSRGVAAHNHAWVLHQQVR